MCIRDRHASGPLHPPASLLPRGADSALARPPLPEGIGAPGGDGPHLRAEPRGASRRRRRDRACRRARLQRVRDRREGARTARRDAPGAHGAPAPTRAWLPRRVPEGGGPLLAGLREAERSEPVRSPDVVRLPGDRRLLCLRRSARAARVRLLPEPDGDLPGGPEGARLARGGVPGDRRTAAVPDTDHTACLLYT